MKSTTMGIRMLCACAFASVAPVAAAHHSPAAYDQQVHITIEGTVTAVEWANPHVYISVREDAAEGEGRVWLVEALSPTALRQFGWSSDTLVQGDRVIVTGNPGRNAARSVTFLESIRKSDAVLFDLAAARAPPANPPAPTIGADGLSGVWATILMPTVQQFLAAAASLPVTAAGAAAIQQFADTVNPGADCVPFPAPLYMILPGIKSIEVRDDVVVIRGEDAAVERTVHMNVASHDGAAPTVQGHSIGRWEGDVLVVDTTQFTEHRLGNGGGLPGGTAKHLVERFQLNAGGGSLTYSFTLEDPDYLTEAVTGMSQWAYRPDVTYAALECSLDNARRFLSE